MLKENRMVVPQKLEVIELYNPANPLGNILDKLQTIKIQNPVQ